MIYLHGSVLEKGGNDMPDDTASAKDRLKQIVLTHESYASAYDTAPLEGISRSKFLRELIENSTIFFIGYSITDYIITQSLSQAAYSSQGEGSLTPMHYALFDGSGVPFGNDYLLPFNPPGACIVEMYKRVYKVHPIFLSAMNWIKNKRWDYGECLDEFLTRLGLESDTSGR